MAKVTKNQRVLRMVRFTLGLRHPDVYQRLLPYGLSQAVLEEGAALLMKATLPTLSAVQPIADRRLLEELDDYENFWFPIVKGVLGRHHPKLGQWLFRNLAQTRGADLIVSMTTFMTRIRQLGTGASDFGDEGKQALALLAERGFTAEVIERGESLVERVTEFEAPAGPELDPEEEERAVDALWQWYLEWSVIARAIIKDRRSLRKLGFRSGSSSPTIDDDLEDDPSEDVDEDELDEDDESFSSREPAVA